MKSIKWKLAHAVWSILTNVYTHETHTTQIKIQNISSTQKVPFAHFQPTPTPATGKCCSDFYQHRLVLPFLEFSINRIIYNILFWGLVSLAKHNAYRIHPYFFMCQWLIPFLLLSRIPRCEYTTVCLFTLLFMNIWAVFSLRLLWIKLLWIFTYKSLCGNMISFLLNKNPGKEFGVLWYAYAFFRRDFYTVFPNGFVTLLSHHHVWEFYFLHILSDLLL